MNLTDYFECIPLAENEEFNWEGYRFNPIQTIHVMSGYIFKHSYGLFIQNPHGYKTFITTDTQFCPYQLRVFYNDADLVFHDCETIPGFKSHVHAHYDDLNTLPTETKNKMHLYHYQSVLETAEKDGFKGFVVKGQEFNI